jgi:hypothetical protein
MFDPHTLESFKSGLDGFSLVLGKERVSIPREGGREGGKEGEIREEDDESIIPPTHRSSRRSLPPSLLPYLR